MSLNLPVRMYQRVNLFQRRKWTPRWLLWLLCTERTVVDMLAPTPPQHYNCRCVATPRTERD